MHMKGKLKKFHKYQQDEQSSLILTQKTTTRDVEIQGPGLGQTENVGRLSLFKGSQHQNNKNTRFKLMF